MSALYNEIDPYAAQWLRNLIAAGHIAPGVVDTRSIADLRPSNLAGYTQVHFFAGIGGWSLAARLAGWPDDRSLWTGSCPCQPFSTAGSQKGFDDTRHLWPEFKRLIAERRPPTVFGEQVASATAWLGLVRSDLETLEYAVGAVPIQAASAGADHLRDRFWFVADAGRDRRQQGAEVLRGRESIAAICGENVDVGVTDCTGWAPRIFTTEAARHGHSAVATGSDFEWVVAADGKARRVKSGIRLLAHGIPERVAKLRGFGNAIDPRPAAAFIGAYLDVAPAPVLTLPPLPY